MTHPPGAVIIPCQELARYHRFTISLANLELPEGSHRIFGIGTNIIDNLNSALRKLRDRDEWVWIVGDDHVFQPDTLMRLLDREEDMVAPLCVRRGPLFPLIHYQQPIQAGSGFRWTVKFDELPDEEEPFEVEVTGSLPLIRRDVLRAIGDPWFTTSNGKLNEEFVFCSRARKAGFRIMVDPAVTVGHIGEFVAYPSRRDGEWGLRLEFPGADRHEIFYPGGINEQVLA